MTLGTSAVLGSVLLGLVMSACGGTSPSSGCTNLCTKSGFTAGTAQEHSNETNCSCTGTGTVTAEECTAMCKSIGKTTGQVYGSGAGATANACQCS